MELTRLYEMESLSELLEHDEAKAVIPELREYISQWVCSETAVKQVSVKLRQLFNIPRWRPYIKSEAIMKLLQLMSRELAVLQLPALQQALEQSPFWLFLQNEVVPLNGPTAVFAMIVKLNPACLISNKLMPFLTLLNTVTQQVPQPGANCILQSIQLCVAALLFNGYYKICGYLNGSRALHNNVETLLANSLEALAQSAAISPPSLPTLTPKPKPKPMPAPLLAQKPTPTPAPLLAQKPTPTPAPLLAPTPTPQARCVQYRPPVELQMATPMRWLPDDFLLNIICHPQLDLAVAVSFTAIIAGASRYLYGQMAMPMLNISDLVTIAPQVVLSGSLLFALVISCCMNRASMCHYRDAAVEFVLAHTVDRLPFSRGG